METHASAIEPNRSIAIGGAIKRRQKAVTSVTAMDVEPRNVEWLLPGLIPFGAITVLSGQPGLGKSLLTTRWAADFSAGRLDEQGDVLMFTAEDPIAEIVVPRLRAAEAMLGSVHFGQLEENGLSLPLRFPSDTDSLDELVREHHARLVVIDPLSAHLGGKVDSFKDQSIREALAPLAALAEDRRLAIVIVAHLNKGQSTDPIQRLGGSVGLPAAARSVLLLGRDPDDPERSGGSGRVLAHVKSNFDTPASSRALRIVSATIDSPLGQFETAEIIEVGPSPYLGPDLLASSSENGGLPKVMSEAVTFLHEVLSDGPRKGTDVEAEAERAGLSVETVKRAKKHAGVETRKQRGVRNGPWLWELAKQPRTTELPAA